MEQKTSSNAASKVRALFKREQKPLTLTDINKFHPELKASEISMALSYLRANRYLTREQVANANAKGRKQIFVYTYHETKLPKVEPIPYISFDAEVADAS